MAILDFSLVQFQAMVLILFRVSGLMFVAPFFGSRNIPTQVQIGMSLLLSLIAFPLVDKSMIPIPLNLGALVMAVICELSVGLLIGFAATFLSAGVQLAGMLIDQEIGFGMANVIDPFSAEQVSIVGQFKFLLALILFILMDGHHYLLRSIIYSYQHVPLVGFRFNDKLAMYVSDRLFTDMFVAAIKISAPCVVALLLTTVAMAFMTRAVPEMNVFILGFSLTIVVGLAVLTLSIPVFAYVFGKLTEKMFASLDQIVTMMQ
jgi:flagellar biosynthetic protein FliR